MLNARYPSTYPSFKDTSVYVNGVAPVETTGDDEVEAPKNAIPSAWSASIVHNRMRSSHSKRVHTFARIQGMLDGNPPYPKSRLQRAGLHVNSNVNWRDGEAITDGVALAYWSLFNDVEHIAQFTTSIGDPNFNPVIGEIVGAEFDTILREWDRFEDVMTEHQKDLCIYGTSFIFWPDKKDWRFEVGDIWRTLVPERTRNHVDFINVLMVEHVMTAQELWEIYESENDKWNKDVLGYILWHTANLSNKGKQYTKDWMVEQQTRIRNGDTCIDEIYNDDISLISTFSRESDGKISRGIFHPDVAGEAQRDWAFFADRQFDEMGEAVRMFTFTPGEKYVHGNKGMGHRIFNTIEGITQIDNSVMDSVRRSSTILVRSRTSRGRDPKQVQFNHGGIVDIGEAEFVQNLMGSNLSSSVDVARYFRFKVDSNNNISGASMSTPDGKPQTLGQAQIQITREAKVQKNRIAHYYKQGDFFMREIVRKMLKSKPSDPGGDLVELWKKRCIEKDVPEEFFVLTRENEGQNGLPEHMRVWMTRASGSGSQVADQIEMQAMMQILPTLGERGRTATLRDFVAANRGHRYIDRYLPKEDQTQQPTGDDTIASIENNQLEKGEMVVVSPDNNHAVHAPRHLQRLQQLAKGFNDAENAAREQGSQTPEVDAGQFGQYSLEEVDIAFQTLGPHFVRHLLYLQQDPTRQSVAKSLGAQWAILANFGDKIANNAQEARAKKLREMKQQQEQLDAMSMEERVKMKGVEVDANIKMRKLIEDMKRAATRDQLEYSIQRQKVSFENEMKRAETVSKISREAASHAREMQEEREAASEVNGKEPTALF